MILAAGRGTRLRPYTDSAPKAMQQVAGQPLICHQLRWLQQAGVAEVVINLHHLGDQLRDRVGDGEEFGLVVRYSDEKTLLETGGGIVAALPLLGMQPFWILLGDIYTDFPLRRFPKVLPEQSLMHLLLTPTPDFRQNGDFECADGRVTRRGNAYVYCGLALFDPQLLANRRAEPFSLREPLFDAVARGLVTAQIWPGHWTDIGTPERLMALRQRLAAELTADTASLGNAPAPL